MPSGSRLLLRLVRLDRRRRGRRRRRRAVPQTHLLRLQGRRERRHRRRNELILLWRRRRSGRGRAVNQRNLRVPTRRKGSNSPIPLMTRRITRGLAQLRHRLLLLLPLAGRAGRRSGPACTHALPPAAAPLTPKSSIVPGEFWVSRHVIAASFALRVALNLGDLSRNGGGQTQSHKQHPVGFSEEEEGVIDDARTNDVRCFYPP